MSGAEQGVKLKSPTSPVSDISTNFFIASGIFDKTSAFSPPLYSANGK